MRLSIDRADRAYDPWLAQRATVSLDGRSLPYCLTADEEEGVAICYALDDSGRPAVDDEGNVKKETLRGVVKIDVKAWS